LGDGDFAPVELNAILVNDYVNVPTAGVCYHSELVRTRTHVGVARYG
jgi:hypothetical protein